MELLIVNIGIVACLLTIFVSSVFLLSRILSDNSVMDIAYGLAFFFTSFIFLTLTDTYNPVSILIAICIAIWAVRLSSRIYLKNVGKPEDARYAKWRNEWTQKGHWYFIIRSYLQVNLLQGFVILLVMMPFLISVSTHQTPSLWLVLLGTLVFSIGLSIETIADHQLDTFIARKKAGTETANLMTAGLFKYSRRPNYFGETLIWWGQAIMVLSLPFGWWALLSPLAITYVVTKITGPMLEQQFLERYGDEYRDYMRHTSYLVPLPPKS